MPTGRRQTIWLFTDKREQIQLVVRARLELDRGLRINCKASVPNRPATLPYSKDDEHSYFSSDGHSSVLY